MTLTNFELKILRHLNGENIPDLQWGSAMGAALEFLREKGFIEGFSSLHITDAGRKAVAEASISKARDLEALRLWLDSDEALTEIAGAARFAPCHMLLSSEAIAVARAVLALVKERINGVG